LCWRRREECGRLPLGGDLAGHIAQRLVSFKAPVGALDEASDPTSSHHSIRHCHRGRCGDTLRQLSTRASGRNCEAFVVRITAAAAVSIGQPSFLIQASSPNRALLLRSYFVVPHTFNLFVECSHSSFKIKTNASLNVSLLQTGVIVKER
jgi:hypothetical protein